MQELYDSELMTLRELSARTSIKLHTIFQAQQRGVFTSRPHAEITKHVNTLNQKGRRHSEARKRKISETVQSKVRNGTWHTSLAKRMHYTYKGVDLHGKWELKYAQWLDNREIKWIRCKQTFEYIIENKAHRYMPDFYLPETDEYIEIKGYKTNKDIAKWSQFPHKLTVLMRSELRKIGIAL